jgi:hypothetical protein
VAKTRSNVAETVVDHAEVADHGAIFGGPVARCTLSCRAVAGSSSINAPRMIGAR